MIYEAFSKLPSTRIRFSFLLSLLIIVVARILFFVNINQPFIGIDEFGYIQNVYRLLGYNFAGTLKYQPGYSILLIPAYYLSDNIQQFYENIQWTNLGLHLSSLFLCFKLLTIINPTVDKFFILLTSTVVFLYPAFNIFNILALSENAIIFFFLLIMWLCYQVYNRGGIWWILWSFALGFCYYIHLRCLPIIFSGVMIGAIISLRRKEYGLYVIFLSEIIVMILLYNYVLIPHLKESIPSGIDSSFVYNIKASHYFKWRSIISVIGTLAGQTLYLITASLGLALWGFLYLIRRFNELYWKKELTSIFILLPAFIIISITGTLLMSSLFMYQGIRFDHHFYGRYTENLLPLLMGLGIINISTFRSTKILLFISLVCLILFSLTFPPHDLIVYLNVSSYWTNWFYNNSIYFWWNANILSSMVIFFLLKKDKLKKYSLILLGAFFLAVTYITFSNWIFPNYETFGNQDKIGKFIENELQNAQVFVEIEKDEFFQKWILNKNALRLYNRNIRRTSFSEWVELGSPGVMISEKLIIDKSSYPLMSETTAGVQFFVYTSQQIQVDSEITCFSPICIEWHGSDDIFTQNGEIVNGKLQSNGSKGFLIFGPYSVLIKGTYQLFIEAEITHNNGFTIDIVGNAGREVYYSKVITADEENNVSVEGRLNAMVNIPKRINDAEIRIKTEAGTIISVSSYRLENQHSIK